MTKSKRKGPVDLSRALATHRAGDLQTAEKLYKSVLKRHRTNVDALHYLGVLLHQRGRHGEAETLISRSLRIDARQPFAHNNLGEVLRAQGKLDAAIRCYREAIQLSPDYTDALNNLGLALAANDEPQAAAEALQRVIQLDPGHAEAWIHLGNLLKDREDYDGAVEAYARVARASALYHDACLNTAAVTLQRGETQAAVQAYRLLAKENPRSVRAVVGLGEALYFDSDLSAAAMAFQQALKIDPSSTEATLRLAACRRELGDPAGAVECLLEVLIHDVRNLDIYEQLAIVYEQQEAFDSLAEICRRALSNECRSSLIHAAYAGALRHTGALREAECEARSAILLAPNEAALYNLLGTCVAGQGRFEEAREAFDQALNLDPEHVQTHNNLGTNHLSLGDKAAARRCFRNALALDPDYAPALENLADLEPLDVSDTERVTHLIRRADDDGLKISHRASLHFALAKAFEATGDYDTSFAHYKAGNTLRAATADYEPSHHEEDVTRVMEVFNKSFMGSVKPGASSSNRPIFIVGMPRSGTTLVEQIVSSHPDVFGAGELSYFDRLQFRHRETDRVLPYWECVESFDEQAVAELAGNYLTMLGEIDCEHPHVTDKLPMNYFHLGLIHLVFPRSRVIYCERNAMDTCVSIFCHNFTFGNHYSRRLFDVGHRYRQHVRLMTHWQTVMGPSIFRLGYEALVADPENVSRQLVAFCGLEWNEACLKPAENKRPVMTASQLQVREPIYRRSVERWRVYADHLQELERGLSDTIGDTGGGSSP